MFPLPVGTGPLENPYRLKPASAEHVDRVIPPKGTKVGLMITSGIISRQFGFGAVPRIVDRVEGNYLYLTSPDGRHTFAHHLADPFVLRPAAECTFFNGCSCQGLGHHKSVLSCEACGGFGVQLYQPFKKQRRPRRRARA